MAETIHSWLQQRIRQPSLVAADLQLMQYLQEVADALNTFPPLSTFSHTTPESNVSAVPGTLGINLAATAPRLWVKYQGSSNTGWWPLASLRTATSLDSTTLLVNDAALSLHASGASLAIRSGGTIWYFTSSMSTKG